MSGASRHLDLARLPEVLHAEDLAAAFRIRVSAARKRIARGDFGPRCKIGRRWVVRRESLLKHLAAQEALPRADKPEPAPPGPMPAYVRRLRKEVSQ